MQPADNPFTPGATLQPPVLAGRQALLAAADLRWSRLLHGRGQRSLLLTGLHGSGKTALLGALAGRATAAGLKVERLTASPERPLAEGLAPALRSLLFGLTGGAPAGGALQVLEAFARTHAPLARRAVDDPAPVLPELPGSGDSGALAPDLAGVLRALGGAASAAGGAGLLMVDEVQALEAADVEALVLGQQALHESGAPLALVLCGLPFQASLGEALATAAERAFDQERLAPLDEAGLEQAVQQPAARLGASLAPAALRELLRLSKGLPFLVQAWAHHAWNRSKGAQVTLEDLRLSADTVEADLDRNFYGPGFERLSPRERAYLRSMAHLGPGPHRSSDVADSMDSKLSSLGPLRARLLRHGLVFSPSHGLVGFAAPGYDAFMRRAMPNFR